MKWSRGAGNRVRGGRCGPSGQCLAGQIWEVVLSGYKVVRWWEGKDKKGWRKTKGAQGRENNSNPALTRARPYDVITSPAGMHMSLIRQDGGGDRPPSTCYFLVLPSLPLPQPSSTIDIHIMSERERATAKKQACLFLHYV